MMPEILADLERLVAIPSVAFPGYPPDPVNEMAAETLEMFGSAGVTDAALLEVPSGYPPLYAEIRCPQGSPVVKGRRPPRMPRSSRREGPREIDHEEPA
jgi:hypothetical protein